MKQAKVKELQKIVRRNYELAAQQFTETRRKEADSGLKDILSKIRPKSRVLDVGCGSGRLLKLLVPKSVAYLGIDSCSALLKLARADFPEHEFRESDLLNLGAIPELNFDYVLAVAVLQHVPSADLRRTALRQLKNKIAPDGRIILVCWNMWSRRWTKPNFRRLFLRFALLKIFGKNKMDFGDIIFDWKAPQGQVLCPRYYHMFRLAELKRLARQSGLIIEEVRQDDCNYYLILKKQ